MNKETKKNRGKNKNEAEMELPKLSARQEAKLNQPPVDTEEGKVEQIENKAEAVLADVETAKKEVERDPNPDAPDVINTAEKLGVVENEVKIVVAKSKEGKKTKNTKEVGAEEALLKLIKSKENEVAKLEKEEKKEKAAFEAKQTPATEITPKPTNPNTTSPGSVAPEELTPPPGVDQESFIAQEAQNFIDQFGLKEFVPENFGKLNEAQQLKTIGDLKQRIVDTVKEEAKAQYLETVSKEKSQASLFGKIAIGVREAFRKESSVKKEEKDVFTRVRDTDPGRKLIAEQMKLLAEINGSQDIIVGKNGELLVDYSKVLQIEDSGAEGVQARDNYNVAANAFRSMPYEWGLEKEGSKQRIAYENAKIEHDKAVNRVIVMKEIKGRERASAVKDMLEIENSLTLEQLLNSHPEIEIEFGKLEEGANKEQVWATIRRLTGTQNKEKVGLLAAGYAARTITKATLGAIAAPVVGAVFGGIRARSKAKETLIERRKEARHGNRDTSNEAEKVVDADKMANHIDSILTQLEEPNITEEKRLSLEKRLQIRIDVALAKREDGLLNFGSSKDAILNQYRLTKSLNQALVRSALFDPEIQKEVMARTDNIMSFRKEKISEAQQKYINDQILMGALKGAGIATAGYMVRAIGEEAGWWGGHGHEASQPSEKQVDSEPFQDSKYTPTKTASGVAHEIINADKVTEARKSLQQAQDTYHRAQDIYNKIPKGEENETAESNLQHAYEELKFQEKYLEKVRGESVQDDIVVQENIPPTVTDTTEQNTVTPPESERVASTTQPDSTVTGIEENTTKATADLEETTIKAKEAQKAYEDALEKQRNAKTYGENESAETEVVRTKEESLAANKKLEETAQAYKEEARVNQRPGKLVKEQSGGPEIKSTIKTKEISGMDPKFVVDKNFGVTHAFREQVGADAKLGSALADQIGYEGKVGTPAFYKALGQHFGYIDKNGDEVRVKWGGKGGMAAYEFVKDAKGNYEVKESHLVGNKWENTETNKDGIEFEGKTEDNIENPKYNPKETHDYEYLHERKVRGPILKETNGPVEIPNGSGPTKLEEIPVSEEESNEEFTEEIVEEKKEIPQRPERPIYRPKAPQGNGLVKAGYMVGGDYMANADYGARGDNSSPYPNFPGGMPPGMEMYNFTPEEIRDIQMEAGSLSEGRSVVLQKMMMNVARNPNLGPNLPVIVYQDIALKGETEMNADLNKIINGGGSYLENKEWNEMQGNRVAKFVEDNLNTPGDKGQLAKYIRNLENASGLEPKEGAFRHEKVGEFIRRAHADLAIKEMRGEFDYRNLSVPGEIKAPAIEVEKSAENIETQLTAEKIDFNKTEMYELWNTYTNDPSALTEEGRDFAGKVASLRRQLGSSFPSIGNSETAQHYLERLEKATNK